MKEILSSLFGSEALQNDGVVLELLTIRRSVVERATAIANPILDITIQSETTSTPEVDKVTADDFMRDSVEITPDTPVVTEDRNPIIDDLERIRRNIEAAREAA